MPPKTGITKEMIIKASFELMRKQGIEAITARNVAGELNCSTQPIYSTYSNMEELKSEIFDMAFDYSQNHIRNYSEPGKKPAEDICIGYIDLAIKEKQLFKTVYLSGYKKYSDEKSKLIGEEMLSTHIPYSTRLGNIEKAGLERMYKRMSVFLTGLGALIVTGSIMIPSVEIFEMIVDMYEMLIQNEKERQSDKE